MTSMAVVDVHAGGAASGGLVASARVDEYRIQIQSMIVLYVKGFFVVCVFLLSFMCSLRVPLKILQFACSQR